MHIQSNTLHVIYFISPSNKTSRKKHVSKKSTFYYIAKLIFKLEIVKHIFENEKLNLNLNSMRLKKGQGPENNFKYI